MSYYWAIPGPSPAPTTYSVMGAQSSLHQERTYLLSALAAEESRGEQLTFSLYGARQKLAAAEYGGGAADEVKSLKKAVTGLERKRRRSQENAKAMINNLAAVASRMQMLEQHQWPRAQFEYNQRSQLSQFNDINTSMQNLALVSPITPNYQHLAQSPISPQTPGFANPIALTPGPAMQWASTYGDGWGSPLYTPFYTPPYEQNQGVNQVQFQVMPNPLPSEDLLRDVQYAGLPGQASDSQHLRAMSLPMLEHRVSWAGKSSSVSNAENEAISPKSGMNLARRLSLIGRASAGLRLGKKVE